MAEFSIFGHVKASKVKFAEFCEWAAVHPSIDPRGQVDPNDHKYRVVINQLLQDVP